MAPRTLRRAVLTCALAATALALFAPGAFAGTQVVHGYDEHCSGGAPSDPACGFTRKVVDYARNGAPNPSLPLLLLRDSDTSIEDEITSAYDPDPPYVVVEPGSPEYDATTFSTDQFSAIVVGTGVGETYDLNARAADFLAFFNQGGGIVTFDTSCTPEGYAFLPLAVEFIDCDGGSPFAVTPEGSATLGITDEETGGDNCCLHSTFADPAAATSPLIVGARDGSDRAVVLFARVDRRAPTSASSGCATTTEVGVTVTDEPNGSGPASVRYQLDGGAEQTVATDASGNARIAVGSGPHTVAFRGVDAAGNVETATNSVTVTCSPAVIPAQPDETRPRTSVLGMPSGCVSRSFFVRVRARDGGGLERVVVRLNGRRILRRPFDDTTRASFRVRVLAGGLRSGRHRLLIRTTDEAGNARVVRRSFRRCARPAVAPEREIGLTG